MQLLEVRLLRQRRFVDVYPPLRAAGFDARNLPHIQTGRRRLRLDRPVPEKGVQLRRREDLEAFHLEIGDARDRCARAVDQHADLRIWGKDTQRAAARPGHLADDETRADAEDAEVPKRSALVRIRRDTRVDVLAHRSHPTLARTRRTVHEVRIVVAEYPHVRNDLSLCRKRGGVLALSGRQ